PSSSEMTSLYIGRSDPTLPRSEGLNSNNDGTERGMGVNVQRRDPVRRCYAYVAHMKFLQFPDVNRTEAFGRPRDRGRGRCRGWLSLLVVLGLPGCGPPTWQGGIHAQLAWSHKGVRVVEVPAESPARRADLREDDRILRIDGTAIEGLPIEAVHALLSGPVGSTATVEVLRGSTEVTLKIAREPYDTPNQNTGVGF
ncbi:MAG: hypothetical protein JWN48_516, partial [Myxococcaceae bacterium]|nr:hypothetical protein [Myxococcaceae bacterium]